MKRLKLIDIIIGLFAAVFVAITLVPAVARMQRTPVEAKCQSNMRRWAEAMALYCSDWGGRFPTNRPFMSNRQPAPAILPTVNLSPPDPIPPATEPPRFIYGPNWVEALYPYLQDTADRTGQDWTSFKRCPAAGNMILNASQTPAAGAHYQVNYTFNRCLTESWSQFVRQPKNLMMMRESARLMLSTLRPANDCTNNSSSPPVDAFWITRDSLIPQRAPAYGAITLAECQMHGTGSHIMFADGHVQAFDISYFATSSKPGQVGYEYDTQARAFDTRTQQWYNYSYANPSTPDQVARNRSIAISP